MTLVTGPCKMAVLQGQILAMHSSVAVGLNFQIFKQVSKISERWVFSRRNFGLAGDFRKRAYARSDLNTYPEHTPDHEKRPILVQHKTEQGWCKGR